MKRILLILLLIPAFLGHAYAEEPERQAMQVFEANKMETGLSEEEAQISGRLGTGIYDVGAALKRLWAFFREKLQDALRENLGFAGSLLSLVLLCAFACALCTEEKMRDIMEICGVCASVGIMAGDVNSLVSQTMAAIYRLSDYSKVTLPVLYTAAAGSGAVSSSAVRYAAACLALDVLMSLSQKAVVPLIYAYLALALGNAVFTNPILTAVEKFSKWAAKTVLTAATLTFTAYLGISSLVSTSVDAAAIKAARTVISTSLPVVGGMLSDASAAVLSSAAVVRSCMGAFGLVAVSAMCMGPLVLLSVKSFLFKAVSVAAESAQSPRLQRLFSGISGVVGLLMGLLGCSAVMLFLSVAAAMKAVTP